MPKECAIGLQKQFRLLVEMSSTLAEEERLVLANPQTYGGLLITFPYERRAPFQIGAMVLARAKREPGRSL